MFSCARRRPQTASTGLRDAESQTDPPTATQLSQLTVDWIRKHIADRDYKPAGTDKNALARQLHHILRGRPEPLPSTVREYGAAESVAVVQQTASIRLSQSASLLP
jgi:hypothetical protein